MFKLITRWWAARQKLLRQEQEAREKQEAECEAACAREMARDRELSERYHALLTKPSLTSGEQAQLQAFTDRARRISNYVPIGD